MVLEKEVGPEILLWAFWGGNKICHTPDTNVPVPSLVPSLSSPLLPFLLAAGSTLSGPSLPILPPQSPTGETQCNGWKSLDLWLWTFSGEEQLMPKHTSGWQPSTIFFLHCSHKFLFLGLSFPSDK